MSSVIIALAVFTLTVLTPSANADCTKLQNGVDSFSLKRLCGKSYYVAYMAGIPDDTTCVLSKLTCDSGEDINVTTKIYRDGVLNTTETSVIKDEGKGVVSRRFTKTNNGKTEELIRKQYILTYSESLDGSFKMSFALCAENKANPTKKGIIGTYKDADYTDELKQMNKLFPNGGIISLPNTCESDF